MAGEGARTRGRAAHDLAEEVAQVAADQVLVPEDAPPAGEGDRVPDEPEHRERRQPSDGQQAGQEAQVTLLGEEGEQSGGEQRRRDGTLGERGGAEESEAGGGIPPAPIAPG